MYEMENIDKMEKLVADLKLQDNQYLKDNPEIKGELDKLLMEYTTWMNVFGVEDDIRRVGQLQLDMAEVLEKQVQELLQEGIIKPSSSQWNTPVVMPNISEMLQSLNPKNAEELRDVILEVMSTVRDSYLEGYGESACLDRLKPVMYVQSAAVGDVTVVEDAVLENAAAVEDITAVEDAAVVGDITAVEDTAVVGDITAVEDVAVVEDTTAVEDVAVVEDITVLEDDRYKKTVPKDSGDKKLLLSLSKYSTLQEGLSEAEDTRVGQ